MTYSMQKLMTQGLFGWNYHSEYNSPFCPSQNETYLSF